MLRPPDAAPAVGEKKREEVLAPAAAVVGLVFFLPPLPPRPEREMVESRS